LRAGAPVSRANRFQSSSSSSSPARRRPVGASTVIVSVCPLRDAGHDQVQCEQILADGTDWRFWNELKRELKS